MSNEIRIETELNFNGKNKEDVIQKIVDIATDIATIQAGGKQEVYQAFIDRENQGSTGLVDGYAIPHAQTDAINFPTLVIIKSDNELEWETMDNIPINFVFGILVPSDEKDTSHLKILSEIAKMLMKSEAKEKLSKANSKENIIKILEEYTSI